MVKLWPGQGWGSKVIDGNPPAQIWLPGPQLPEQLAHIKNRKTKRRWRLFCSLSLLNRGIVPPPFKPLPVLLLVLYIWNLHAEKQLSGMKVRNNLIQLKEVSFCSCKVKSSRLFLVQKTAGYTWMSTSFMVLHKCKQVSKKNYVLLIKLTALQPPPVFPY